MRILVTSSRTWDRPGIINDLLFYVIGGQTSITVVHGDCYCGGDRMADDIALKNGWDVERHPAKWEKYGGKRAGYVRNAEMVALGADVCLAFIKDASKGATMCAKLAEKAGIETFRIRPVKLPSRRR